MSLLMDLLKKVGEKDKKRALHPSISRVHRAGGSRRSLFFGLAAGFLVISVFAYIFSTRILERFMMGEDYSTQLALVKDRAVKREQEIEEPVEVSEQTVNDEEMEEIVEVEEQITEEEPPVEEKEIIQAKMSADSKKAEVEKLLGDLRREEAAQFPPKGAENLTADYTSSLFYADHYFREGNLKKSMEFYEKAYSIRKSTKVANNLILIYIRLGLIDRAKKLAFQEKDEKLLYTYIVELARSYGSDRALKEIERAISFDRRGYLYFARGYLREKAGDIILAFEDYKRAYKKDPSNPYFAYNYARLLEQRGKLRDALIIYNSLNAGDLDPKIRNIVRERIDYLRSLGLSR
jgi:tetratricopeptide (TPR) repeat protein